MCGYETIIDDAARDHLNPQDLSDGHNTVWVYSPGWDDESSKAWQGYWFLGALAKVHGKDITKELRVARDTLMTNHAAFLRMNADGSFHLQDTAGHGWGLNQNHIAASAALQGF
jgi:hypothetical protein